VAAVVDGNRWRQASLLAAGGVVDPTVDSPVRFDMDPDCIGDREAYVVERR
jgi:hypothetical protein